MSTSRYPLRRKRILIALSSCFAAATAFMAFTNPGRIFYASLAAPYPEAWLRISPGMISKDVWGLLGPPWANGRQLKSVDRWKVTQNGVELHLDIDFMPESAEDAAVSRVLRWKQILIPGSSHFDKHVEPPRE